MKNLIFVLSNWKYYKYWRKIKKGKKPIDWERGCGYYIMTGLLGHDPRGKIEEHEMKSGKIGLWELIDYRTFRDPYDMIDKSWWHFLGYKGEKLLKEMNFKEFLSTVKQ